MGAVTAEAGAARSVPLPVVASLLALAGIRSGETVADVACGAGLVTRAAAAAAGSRGRVYGLDPDAALLAAARARRESAVVWVRGLGNALPFRDGCLDKVVCGPVLHLGGDVRPVLAEWARVLRPGGRAAVAAWGALSGRAEESLAAALDAPALLAGGCFVEAADLGGLLGEAGLRVVHAGAADRVRVPFDTAEAYAAWRLSFLRPVSPSDAGLRARVVDALGPGPVVADAVVHSVTASPQM